MTTTPTATLGSDPRQHAPVAPDAAITGLVLAGGAGRRMGGCDKGLLLYRGQPLAQLALQRLAPQVDALALSANRHLEAYAAFGVPVWPDDGRPSGAPADAVDAVPVAAPETLPFDGPLAGMLAGLRCCKTPLLATVPCDTPHFPLDLVARLQAALLAEDAELAMALTRADDRWVRQPVFCLLRRELLPSLDAFLASGERKVGLWTARHRCAQVRFDADAAFTNANTPADLARLDHD